MICINLVYDNKLKAYRPEIKIVGKTNYTTTEWANILYWLETGGFASSLEDKLSSLPANEHKRILMEADMMHSVSSNIQTNMEVEEAKIPILTQQRDHNVDRIDI